MTDGEIHVEPLRSYLLVFGVLLALTALTTWAGYQDLGAWNAPVAIGIATIKALFVAVVFMHLRHADRLMWLFAGAAVVWLLILFALTLADFDTRTVLPPWER